MDEVEEPRRQQAAVFIAARAALRVAPVLYGLFEFSGEGDDWPSLLDLRSLLISSVAATMPSDDIKRAAGAAVYATNAVTHGDNAAVRAAFYAVKAAQTSEIELLIAALSKDAGGAELSAEVAVRAADDAAYTAHIALEDRYTIWRATQRDAVLWMEHAVAQTGSLSIDIAPLWEDENPLDAEWETLQDRMRNDPSGEDWSFWINWYQGILDGIKQDWCLLCYIATSPVINWDAPATDVSAQINMVVDPSLDELKRLQDEVVVLEAQFKKSQDVALAYAAKLKEKSAKEELSGVLDAWEGRAKSADYSSRIYLIVIGLVIAALVAGAIYVIVCVEFERLDALLIPSGCANLAIDACVGLTQRTAFLTVIFLTLVSVILLVLRILLRAYNSNIFWRDDARERIAFATVYINMLGNTTTSQKTDDYARIVYETLFRAANSKMPVEDVSVGLSISDNLAKSLVK